MPNPHGQEIVNNDTWMGGYQESTKKWTKPKETKSHKEGESWKESEDWLGGGSSMDMGYSPRRNSSKPQIKIDGLRSSIKDNPFLKNNN